nr:methylmalonyl Co-A mutase-associated GTPase MeaB [Candidatus Neomarinimicrobiota bacterium]
DRIRMNRYVWDDSVFIRSMSSGGDLGGLTHKAQEVGDVMAASGKDVIIYETVGVGQAEHDVAKAVDVTILILVPESGDEIQLMKAGLIEIADIFVINKSDREGAGRLAQILKNILHTARHSDNSEPLVFNTVGNTGEGVEDFIQGIFKFIDDQKASKRFNHKRLTHHRDRVLSIIQDRLIHKFWTSKRLEKLALATKNLDTIETSPQQLAQEFIGTGNEKKRKRP